MAVRIAGINLNENKNIDVALLAIFGLGRPLIKRILTDLKIKTTTKVKDLTEKELNAIRDAISTIPVEGDLRRTIAQNIKRLQDIGTYRGDRHKKRLPARGQRTRTNARTKRGKRVTMGSGRVTLTKT